MTEELLSRLMRTIYPPLTGRVGRCAVIPLRPTPSDIAHDLRELTHVECAERGIRHSSIDDQSTAIITGDAFELRRGMLRAHARKTLERC